MDTSDLVWALKQIPEARLRLIELAWEVFQEDGSLDGVQAAFLRKELEEALGEAQAYAQATEEAVRCLRGMARSSF